MEFMTTDAALARLSEAGLACGRSSMERLHIQGGMSRFDVHGIQGYERPFMIFEEKPGSFTASVAGVRPFHDEEAIVPTLAEAVEVVLRVYRDRGMLPVEDDR